MFFIEKVVNLAEQALNGGCFPNGALITQGDRIVSESISLSEKILDPTAHAETSVIRDACSKLKTRDLANCVLYTSLEPCLMCLHSSFWAGIREVIYCCSRNLVSPNCFEGALSALDAQQYLREKISLTYNNALSPRVVDLHKRFSSIKSDEALLKKNSAMR